MKAICTLLVFTLFTCGIYWAATTPWTPQISHSSTGTLPSTSPTSPNPTVTTSPSTTTHSHHFGSAWESDDNLHWQECTCGEQTNAAAHTDTDLDSRCDICDADLPVLHEHNFGDIWEFDDTNHWCVCECGEQANVAAHVDTDVNGKCDVCDADVPLPPHEHSFGTAWESDRTNHWHVCECGEQTNIAAHVDADVNGKCDVCDADVPLPHEHSFGSEWISDDTNHWHVCECGEKTNPAIHIDANRDAKCDVCTASVAHEHSFGDIWKFDDINHWHVCVCGEQADVSAHLDINTNGKCDICNAEVSLPPHEHDYGTAWSSDENEHWQVCACGERAGTAAHADNNKDHRCDTCAYVVSLPEAPSLNAHSAFIFDCEKNDYLFKNQSLNKVIYPASITKLFSCYVALKYLTPEEEILLGSEQYLVPYDTSKAGFSAGQTVSVDALLHGALMPSGSDAVHALAAAAGKKILNNPNATARAAVDAFVDELNEQAQLLGMGNTHFVTPDGYHDSQHYISFHAFVTIARCAMNNPHILSICGKATATITYKDAQGAILTRDLRSSNRLLHSKNSNNTTNEYYIPHAVGLKTGTTSKAGACLMSVFMINGRCIIIGIFGCPDDTARWEDAIALWNYYLALEALST